MIDKDTLLEALEKECQLADSMDEIKVVLGLTKAIYIVSRTSSSEPEPKPFTLDELRECEEKWVRTKQRQWGWLKVLKCTRTTDQKYTGWVRVIKRFADDVCNFGTNMGAWV